MTRYSKYNFVYRMQKWMDSVPGQTFLNYAYTRSELLPFSGYGNRSVRVLYFGFRSSV